MLNESEFRKRLLSSSDKVNYYVIGSRMGEEFLEM